MSHNPGVLIENLNSANSAFVERQDAVAEVLVSRGYDPGVALPTRPTGLTPPKELMLRPLTFAHSEFFGIVRGGIADGRSAVQRT